VLEKLDEVRGSTLLPQGIVPASPPTRPRSARSSGTTVEADPAKPRGRRTPVGAQQVLHRPPAQLGPGVSEVATVGGAPLEYQIDVKPEALRAYGVTLGDV